MASGLGLQASGLAQCIETASGYCESARRSELARRTTDIEDDALVGEFGYLRFATSRLIVHQPEARSPKSEA